jgi:acetolactate synthase small subunit
MNSIYTITVVSDGTLTALQRIIGICFRQKVNIQQMNMFTTDHDDYSHCSIVIRGTEQAAVKVLKQLQRIVELLQVEMSSRMSLKVA